MDSLDVVEGGMMFAAGVVIDRRREVDLFLSRIEICQLPAKESCSFKLSMIPVSDHRIPTKAGVGNCDSIVHYLLSL